MRIRSLRTLTSLRTLSSLRGFRACAGCAPTYAGSPHPLAAITLRITRKV